MHTGVEGVMGAGVVVVIGAEVGAVVGGRIVRWFLKRVLTVVWGGQGGSDGCDNGSVAGKGVA